MKTLLALLLVSPTLLWCTEHHEISYFKNQPDLDLYYVMQEKPKDEQMYQYSHEKATELSYKSCQTKKYSHEWFYLMGQVDAFTQVHRIYTLEKN